jgi:hypothetical protein
MNESSVCTACESTKVTAQCGVCESDLCRKCAKFLETGTFTFLAQPAPELTQTWYCDGCYGAHVEPALDAYRETLAKAEGVFVFFTTHKRVPPLLNRAKNPIKVDVCADRDETILRIAFRAVEQGFNALVETEVSSAKVRDEGYQKMTWRGSGIPAQVDAERLDRYQQD